MLDVSVRSDRKIRTREEGGGKKREIVEIARRLGGVVNLLGLDSEANTRRRRCHEAALLRFVMPTETVPEVQYSKTHKRRSDDDDIVKKTLLELCGGDSWSPLLCGYAHTG